MIERPSVDQQHDVRAAPRDRQGGSRTAWGPSGRAFPTESGRRPGRDAVPIHAPPAADCQRARPIARLLADPPDLPVRDGLPDVVRAVQRPRRRGGPGPAGHRQDHAGPAGARGGRGRHGRGHPAPAAGGPGGGPAPRRRCSASRWAARSATRCAGNDGAAPPPGSRWSPPGCCCAGCSATRTCPASAPSSSTRSTSATSTPTSPSPCSSTCAPTCARTCRWWPCPRPWRPSGSRRWSAVPRPRRWSRSPGALHPVEVVWCPPPATVARTDARGVTPAFLDHVAATTRRALAERPGDVLVFVPGAGEVAAVARRLAGVEADVRPLHGRLSHRGAGPGADRGAAAPGGRLDGGGRVLADGARRAGRRRRRLLPRAAHRPPARPGRAGHGEREPGRGGAAGRAGRPGGPRRGVPVLVGGRPRAPARARPAGDRHRGPHRLRARAGLLGQPRRRRPRPARPAARRRRWPPPTRPSPVSARCAPTAPSPRAAASSPPSAPTPAWPGPCSTAPRSWGRGGPPRWSRCCPSTSAPPGADLVAALRDLRRGGPDAAAWAAEVRRLRAALPEGAATPVADGPGNRAADGATRAAPAGTDLPEDLAVGAVVALAHPDRIARRRPGGSTYLMTSGTGAALPPGSPLAGLAWLAVADADRGAGRRDATIRSAAPIDEAVARGVGAGAGARGGDRRLGRRRGGGPAGDGGSGRSSCPPRRSPTRRPALVAAAVRDGLAQDGLAALPWTPAATALRERLGVPPPGARASRGRTCPTRRCSRAWRPGWARTWPGCGARGTSGASTCCRRCAGCCRGRRRPASTSWPPSG